jgi:hypothetical protein
MLKSVKFTELNTQEPLSNMKLKLLVAIRICEWVEITNATYFKEITKFKNLVCQVEPVI